MPGGPSTTSPECHGLLYRCNKRLALRQGCIKETSWTARPFRSVHNLRARHNRRLPPANLPTGGVMLPITQEKDAKVAYLKKIIEVVSMVLGEQCPARPNKVRRARAWSWGLARVISYACVS